MLKDHKKDIRARSTAAGLVFIVDFENLKHVNLVLLLLNLKVYLATWPALFISKFERNIPPYIKTNSGIIPSIFQSFRYRRSSFHTAVWAFSNRSIGAL